MTWRWLLVKKITTLEEALKRIEKLEKENAELKEANADLKEELEYFKKRKACGRQSHNAKWMAIYNDFVVCHEQGMTMVEIAKRNGISERSIYRYKAYYDEMQKKKKGKS
jgi:transposase-like protein